MIHELKPGAVVRANLSPAKGREQVGHRPAVVISNRDYLSVVTKLVIVLPATTTNREWPNHILLTGPTGLPEPTYAITEQPRAIDRSRITDIVGEVDPKCLDELGMWLRDWTVP